MEYKSYSSDMDAIFYSPYYAALSAKMHGKLYDATSYLDAKDILTRRLAEKYGADPDLAKALLYARELGRPPLEDVGEKFMKDELGVSPLQASVLVAKDLELSDELVGELSRLDAPTSKEGLIVGFVNDKLDKLLFLNLDLVNDIFNDITAADGKLQLGEETLTFVEECANKNASTGALLHDQKEMSAIRDKLAPLGGGADAVLGLAMLGDGDFKTSILPKSFEWLKDRGTPTGI